MKSKALLQNMYEHMHCTHENILKYVELCGFFHPRTFCHFGPIWGPLVQNRPQSAFFFTILDHFELLGVSLDICHLVGISVFFFLSLSFPLLAPSLSPPLSSSPLLPLLPGCFCFYSNAISLRELSPVFPPLSFFWHLHTRPNILGCGCLIIYFSVFEGYI